MRRAGAYTLLIQHNASRLRNGVICVEELDNILFVTQMILFAEFAGSGSLAGRALTIAIPTRPTAPATAKVRGVKAVKAKRAKGRKEAVSSKTPTLPRTRSRQLSRPL